MSVTLLLQEAFGCFHCPEPWNNQNMSWTLEQSEHILPLLYCKWRLYRHLDTS